MKLDLEASCKFIHVARLAQLVERKALNLVVVGSSPTVGASFCFLPKGRVGHHLEVRTNVNSMKALWPNG